MTKFNPKSPGQIKPIAIIGAGGFGRETLCCFMDMHGISAADISNHAVFLESDSIYKSREINGVKALPLSELDVAVYEVVVAVGDPEVRKTIVQQLPSNCTFANIVHPSVVISEWVSLGKGCIITAGTILTCNITIGDHAHLNLHTTIGHDCVIGKYFTTAPGANISGNCKIADEVYIGTNASLKQGVEVCEKVTIGMGAVVVKSITQSGVYVGAPAKPINR